MAARYKGNREEARTLRASAKVHRTQAQTYWRIAEAAKTGEEKERAEDAARREEDEAASEDARADEIEAAVFRAKGEEATF